MKRTENILTGLQDKQD